MDNKKSEGKGGGKAEKSSRKERRKEQNSCKKKVGKCRGVHRQKNKKQKQIKNGTRKVSCKLNHPTLITFQMAHPLFCVSLTLQYFKNCLYTE